MNRKKMFAALICGILGCICIGSGDWLTKGAAQIAPWRNALAMALPLSEACMFLWEVAKSKMAVGNKPD